MLPLLRTRKFDESALDASSHLPLPEGDIHLWKAFMGELSSRINELESLLDGEEIRRAKRFRFQKDVNRFVAAHGILRKIIGRYMDISPRRVSFRTAPTGKQELDDRQNPEPFFFNISHSHDLAVLAFSRSHQLGIDVEHIRSLPDLHEIIHFCFHPKEIAVIRNLPVSEQRQAFFQFWTGKEAFVKGTGEGLSRPLDSFALSPCGKRKEGLLRIEECAMPAEDWRLLPFRPAGGYAGTLAFTIRIASGTPGNHCSGQRRSFSESRISCSKLTPEVEKKTISQAAEK
jgi:4'-phosphopantetheinyl transferase